MPLCVEVVSNALVMPAAQPVDISTCAMVVLTGGEFSQVNLLAQQQLAPYNAIDGAQLWAIMFTSTLLFYLSIRPMSEILKLVRSAKNS